MGSPVLSWSMVAVSVLVAMVSAARTAAAVGREARFAAGGDLVMAGGMAAMFLPATSASFGDHVVWWVTLFAAVGVGGVALSVRSARRDGWRRGRHWAHHVLGSAAMVIMTLAMPGTTSGPVLALGSGHGHAHGAASAEDTSGATGAGGGTAGTDHSTAGTDHSTAGMDHSAGGTGHSMAGKDHSAGGAGHAGTSGHDMASVGAQAAVSSGAASVWRLVLAGLAVYFALSMVAALRTRFRTADRTPAAAGRRSGRTRWVHHLLALPDAVVVFLASLAVSAWDRTRPGGERRRAHAAAGSRRRPPGTSPGAALLAHVGMGSTMSVMLVMMAA
ncbi:DUF5134 domain-containing protein [Streptomyces sp. NPDC005931]|uniref:DUF5134 domain-containing protein n=1 Tax=Streptomyces sp. NPDC005931 TaxID=3364737 RepID=UPI0036A8BBD3